MNTKPVLAFSLLGIIKNQDPWTIAHKKGMKELSEKANMPELTKKINDPDYFEYVKKALEKIEGYKELSENERISKRRKKYFNNVLEILREGDYIDKEFINFLKELKDKYEIMLITTNIKSFVDEVLKLSQAENLYDYIICSESSKEDNKQDVFSKAIKSFTKPNLYIGSKKSQDVCKEYNIKFIKYEGINELKEVLENE
jgi:hypothetical protein